MISPRCIEGLTDTAESTNNKSCCMQDIYLLTKSMEHVQLVPTSDTGHARILNLFMNFVWQNLQIEADKYIAIAATSYGEMLRNV